MPIQNHSLLSLGLLLSLLATSEICTFELLAGATLETEVCAFGRCIRGLYECIIFGIRGINIGGRNALGYNGGGI